MTQTTATAHVPGRDRDGAVAWAAPDPRRLLQLGLAALWLLDGVLQYQSFMYTRAFGQMLAGGAAGNPGVIAHPITWAAGIITHHPASTNTAFATIQLLLGLGIAWRPLVKPALAASVVWSIAVYWFGEGLGGILVSPQNVLSGAPGAVILYALLAVLIWPTAPSAARPPFVAARPVGPWVAKGLWLVLWGSLAWWAIAPVNRTAQAAHDMLASMADGEPHWLRSLDRAAASLVAHQGLATAVVLTVVLAVIALGVFAPPAVARLTLALAIGLSVLIWLVAQDLGEILAGGSTDVNSAPLLVLLALAYWPLRPSAPETTLEGTAS